MNIIVGKYSGFCNGVKYTVTKTLEELSKNKPLYSLGEIVHNEEVVNNLKNKGLIVKDKIEDIPNNSISIIRAHGEPVKTYEMAKKKNIQLIDLTCGKVKLIHTKILNKKDQYFILIIGKKNHPETIAHYSYGNNSYVIEEVSDINESYRIFKESGLNKVYLVAQTTFNNIKFDELVSQIKEVYQDIPLQIDKTICNTTSLRQGEAYEISKQSDKMIIIGGKNSSNTKELAEISEKNCSNVYLIQTYQDLEKKDFNKNDTIGIMAGASTSQDTIQDVLNYLNNLYK